MDWTREKALEAQSTLFRWREMISGVSPDAPLPTVISAIADDLNTAAAIAELHQAEGRGDLAGLKGSAMFLGLLEDGSGDWFLKLQKSVGAYEELREVLIIRSNARKQKDFKKADLIRDLMTSYGLTLEDQPDGNVKPVYQGFGMFDYFNSLDVDSRRDYLGRQSYEAGDELDGSELVNSYQRMIAREILDQLK